MAANVDNNFCRTCGCHFPPDTSEPACHEWMACRDAQSSRSEAVDEGCICKGNWRAIVKEYAPMIGKTFKRGDKAYRFFGLVHGEDDYYYGLVETGSKVVLSSCVGSLEMNGLEETNSQSAPEGKE